MHRHMRAEISEQSVHHVTLMSSYFFFSGLFCDELSQIENIADPRLLLLNAYEISAV